jgi:hypothetical protein
MRERAGVRENLRIPRSLDSSGSGAVSISAARARRILET